MLVLLELKWMMSMVVWRWSADCRLDLSCFHFRRDVHQPLCVKLADHGAAWPLCCGTPWNSLYMAELPVV